MEPLTLLGALKLAKEDPAAALLDRYPEAKPDETKAAKWAGTWRRNWELRFVKR